MGNTPTGRASPPPTRTSTQVTGHIRPSPRQPNDLKIKLRGKLPLATPGGDHTIRERSTLTVRNTAAIEISSGESVICHQDGVCVFPSEKSPTPNSNPLHIS